MDRIRTVATFVAGVLVGGGAVYFSPPEGSDALSQGAGMPSPDMAHPVDGALLPDGSKPPLPPLPGTAGAPTSAEGTTPPVPPGGAAGSPVAPATTGTGAPPPTPTPEPQTTTPPVASATPEGPPPEETPAAPAGPAPVGNRLEKHLRNAPTLWGNVLAAAQKSQDKSARALAPEIEAHIEGLPTIGDHMPPLQEIASYLASSRVLLDRLAAAGVDVSELSLQIDVLMRPPRGKIPGGPKGDAAASPG